MKNSRHLISLCISILALVPLPGSTSPGQARYLVADLRSFLHGEPAPVPKKPPPKQLAVVSTAPGVAADAQIESFFREFAAAILARDGVPLLKRVADKYAIDDLPGDRKPADMLLQAIAQIEGPNEIVIKTVEKQNNVRIAAAAFVYGNGKMTVKTFRFDGAGKLLWSDLFQLKVQQFGA